MSRDEMLDKREDVLDEFDDRVDPSHGVMTLAETRWFTAQLLADEIMRLRAVLAMLKKPDIDVLASAMTAWSRTGDVQAMLHAALTAAEREASA